MTEKTSNKKLKIIIFTLFIIFLFAFTYLFPRFIIDNFDKASPWASYLYQYGFGTITFLIGMFVILKTKSLQLKRKTDFYWFKWLIFGFLVYSLGHLFWILAAIYT